MEFFIIAIIIFFIIKFIRNANKKKQRELIVLWSNRSIIFLIYKVLFGTTNEKIAAENLLQLKYRFSIFEIDAKAKGLYIDITITLTKLGLSINELNVKKLIITTIIANNFEKLILAKEFNRQYPNYLIDMSIDEIKDGINEELFS